VDLVVVLSGTVALETDDDAVELHPGDTVVQNGTMHRWSNTGSGPAVLASVSWARRVSAEPIPLAARPG
jgi:quercetin dioxygenase-like cupin family protein